MKTFHKYEKISSVKVRSQTSSNIDLILNFSRSWVEFSSVFVANWMWEVYKYGNSKFAFSLLENDSVFVWAHAFLWIQRSSLSAIQGFIILNLGISLLITALFALANQIIKSLHSILIFSLRILECWTQLRPFLRCRCYSFSGCVWMVNYNSRHLHKIIM